MSGNVYTWYINEGNKDNINIEIKVSKTNIVSTIVIYGALALIAIIVMFLIIKFYQKNKKANEFWFEVK